MQRSAGSGAVVYLVAELPAQHRRGQAISEEKARAWEGIREFYGEERTNYPVTLDVDDVGEGFRLKTQVEASVDAQRVCPVHAQGDGIPCGGFGERAVPAIERAGSVAGSREATDLYEWNATEAAYPRERCVHELFEEQVEKTPDAVAVVYEDTTLSYAELNRRANELAHYLRELGVGPDREWPSAWSVAWR